MSVRIHTHMISRHLKLTTTYCGVRGGQTKICPHVYTHDFKIPQAYHGLWRGGGDKLTSVTIFTHRISRHRSVLTVCFFFG